MYNVSSNAGPKITAEQKPTESRKDVEKPIGLRLKCPVGRPPNLALITIYA